MTKKELSDRSGVSISFLSDLTTGKANPSLKVMEDIAQALETPLTLLLESTELDKEALDALAGGKAPEACRQASSAWRPCCQNTRRSSSRSGAKRQGRNLEGVDARM
uniref:TrbA n=1 Tax=Pseudomonas putida TaxID=303 RepID=C7T5B0_PSEPU|nr:TrbA [Pseudomonas putida]